MNSPSERRLAQSILDTLQEAMSHGSGAAGGRQPQTPTEPTLYAYRGAWQGTIASHVEARDYLSRQAAAEKVIEGRRKTRKLHLLLVLITLASFALLVSFDPLRIVHAPICPTEAC